MSTSERMLKLLSLLQTHRYWPGEELAERLAVSQRTLRRDVERLRELGYDVQAARGVAGGYQLRAGRALPPLLLEGDEAVAIAVGLRGTAAAAIDGGGQAAVRALAKVMGMLPPKLRSQLDAIAEVTLPGRRPRVPSIDAEALARLASCCRDRELAEFDYVDREANATKRRVEPYGLVSFEQRWYLVAFDRVRDDWRTFRLDRIAKVGKPLGRFVRRELPADSPLEMVRAGQAKRPRRHDVALRFACAPETVRTQTGSWGEVEPDGDGCVWRIGVDELDWPVMVAALIGVEVEVLGPPELAERLRATGRVLAAV